MKTTYRYSTIFHSLQGEGTYCGRSTAWLRLFACNLTCAGFGQADPTKPETYIEPYKTFNVSTITSIEQLPVWQYGCDSSYSWSKRFKHLMYNDTAEVICDKIQNVLKHSSNPNGMFLHCSSSQWHHLAFTGGEPLLNANQQAIVAVLDEFGRRGNRPKYITIETNGTQAVQPVLENVIALWHEKGGEWFWSVSPKLFSTSGEKESRAVRPEVIGQYCKLSDKGHIKYVVNGTQQSWDEVEHVTRLLRQQGVLWDVYIMPVGATKEQQERPVIGDIVMEAMKRGYHVAARVHNYIFENAIGK